MTFWDFCAPFYDFAERRNGAAYASMVKAVCETMQKDMNVIEIAAGTGAISLAAANKVKTVYCTDISGKMLAVAKKKAIKRGTDNITFGNVSIFNTNEPDNAYDAVIASQVLHLIDEPGKAAAELKRIAKSMVILPLSLTKDLKGVAKFNVTLWRLVGFSPKHEFDLDSYKFFLEEIGFKSCEVIPINGKIPMAVAIWKKTKP